MPGNIFNKKINDQVEELYDDTFHLSQYFPEDSDETVTFTAGGTNNTFGAWAEIVDNNPVTFSSKMATCNGHVSTVLVENASIKDEVYIFEISYGASNTIVLRGRVLSATILLSTVQQDRRRALKILAGETIYYRMKCETAGATLRVSLRYHCH
ncbi:MAG: hypothetical protein JRF25_00515 [Deltaproteobacteria bacterium]|nr:hypothetical protein [Deltaproteobacteria bacterium]